MSERMAYPSPLAKVEFALPFDHTVIAWLDCENGRKFCILKRRDNYHPFVVYEILLDGSCHHGDYVGTLAQAYRCFTRRIGLMYAVQEDKESVL